MNDKKSLLFITTELPWPADSGGRIKTYRLVEFLAQHFDLKLVCAHGKKDAETLSALRQASGISSVQVFDTFRKRTGFNWFMGLMRFPTFNAYRVYSKQMESMMRWGIEQSDVVIVDHLEMMEMIPERLVPKVIYHSHNAEFKLWEDLAHLETNPLKKGTIALEANRVKLFERWAIKRSKFTFAAPNDSALLIEKCGIDPVKFQKTYHLGDETLLDLPEIDLQKNAPRIFYAGTLSWMPNHDGLIWFIRKCWPAIKEKVPNAEMVVCGRGADSDLLSAIRSNDGMEHKGFVDNLDDEMSQCRCAVVPLRFGSGMKIKTFDAMYRGLPLVTTSSGADGIEIQNGKHAFVSDEAADFTQSVVELLSNTAKGSELAREAKALVSERYTYPIIFREMLGGI